jgi:4-hydroxy-2-oxoheptanedioate aldolase
MSGDRRPAFREVWDAGEPTYGGWCSIPTPLSVELMGRAGFDWLCIDLEHGGPQPADLIPMLTAAAATQTPAFVRVPWNEPGIIMKALDCGAAGVIVPMVNSVAEAERAVGACRYPPAGYRSWGPLRAALAVDGYNPEIGNRGVLCAVMMETVEGTDAIDEILAVPGIDAAFVGPADLALSAGLAPRLDSEDPAHLERLRRIVAACRKHSVVAGIFSGPLSRRHRQEGFRMLALATDSGELSAGARRALAAARAPD